MTEIEKDIIYDYEAKAVQLDGVRKLLFFILDSTADTCRIAETKADSTKIKAMQYDNLQELLPLAINLLCDNIQQMQDNTEKLYNAKRDTKEHTESRQA